MKNIPMVLNIVLNDVLGYVLTSILIVGFGYALIDLLILIHRK